VTREIEVDTSVHAGLETSDSMEILALRKT